MTISSPPHESTGSSDLEGRSRGNNELDFLERKLRIGADKLLCCGYRDQLYRKGGASLQLVPTLKIS